MMRHHRCRWLLLVSGLVLTLAGATPVWAGCGVTDVGACVDDAQYNLWYGAAAFVWTAIDAPLLYAAYVIDVFRAWLVETAFASAYQALVQLIDPLIVPFAVIALAAGYLLFALSPLIGRTRLMNVAHVLRWTLLVPLLLTSAGLLLATVEQARIAVGTAIYAQTSAIAPGAIFGVAANDMAAPRALYGGTNPCGGGSLVRPSGSVAGALRMDDLAAALLYADAQDIHCPAAAGPGRDLPDGFFRDPPDGPGFASEARVGDMDGAAERQAAVTDMQRGYNRLMLGILPCLLAVAESVVQLLFALALVLLWAGLPFALAFIFFEESSASVAALFRQGLAVLKASWFCALPQGIMFAALQSAAEQGNATAYTAVAFLALLLLLFLVFVAGRTLWGSVNVLNGALLQSVGVNMLEPVQQVGQLAAGAASGAALIATGGAAAVASAATATARFSHGAWERIGSEAGTAAEPGIAPSEQAEPGLSPSEQIEERQVSRHLRTAQREHLIDTLAERWQQARGVETVPVTPEPLAAPGDRTRNAYQWADEHLHRLPPRAAEDLPPDAQTLPQRDVQLPRLLRQGYIVQHDHQERTVSFWHPDPEPAAAPANMPSVPTPPAQGADTSPAAPKPAAPPRHSSIPGRRRPATLPPAPAAPRGEHPIPGDDDPLATPRLAEAKEVKDA